MDGFKEIARQLKAQQRERLKRVNAQKNAWYRELGQIWVVVVQDSATKAKPAARSTIRTRKGEIGWVRWGGSKSMTRYLARLDTFEPHMVEYLSHAFKEAML